MIKNPIAVALPTPFQEVGTQGPPPCSVSRLAVQHGGHRATVLGAGIKAVVDTSQLSVSLRDTLRLTQCAWWELTLNRYAERVSTWEMARPGIDIPIVAFRWNDGDTDTEDWYPQRL